MSLPPAPQRGELSQEDQLFAVLRDRLTSYARLPITTYRLQLHAAFTFAQASDMIPYLHSLGITTCSTSPPLQAMPGACPGFHPQLGSAADYAALVHTLQAHDMEPLLEIMPQQMRFSTDNVWWMDVLQHGSSSAYAAFFEIDWQPHHGAWRDQVLLPILPQPYGLALENRQIQIHYEGGAFRVDCAGWHLPVEPGSTVLLLRPCVSLLEQQLGETHPQTLELQSILTALTHLPTPTTRERERRIERRREGTIIQQRLAALYAACPALQTALTNTLQHLNGVADAAPEVEALHAVLEAQVYRLGYWRTAGDVLNYRRCADATELLALRVEDPLVFDVIHAPIFTLLEEGRLSGVRLAHLDTLADPLGYLQRLQRTYVQRHCRRLLAAHAGVLPDARQALEDALLARFDTLDASQRAPLYVLVEKTLLPGERLPVSWPVHGTTGSEFVHQLNGIFVDRRRARSFRSLYAAFVGEREPFASILYSAKEVFLRTHLRSELDALGALLQRLAALERHWRDLSGPAIHTALCAVLACFPVSRTYIGPQTTRLSPADRHTLEVALRTARQRHPAVLSETFEYLHAVLHLHAMEHTLPGCQELQRQILRSFQQLTAAVLARGQEDMAKSRYTPLASLNDNGGDPGHFGMSVFAWHRANLARQQHWPQTLLATATQDTRRGEDMRARLNVLSEMPQAWRNSLKRWQQWNRPHKTLLDGHLVPSRQEEYLCYQTLLGAWPMASAAAPATLRARLQAAMRQALRDARAHSSWQTPNHAYEQAVDAFVAALLDDPVSADFLADFCRFQAIVAHYGVWNSLSQTLLKLTAPGVPELDQGTELWDLRLAGADHQQPVDYALRQRLLQELQQRYHTVPRLELLQELLQHRMDGRIKLFVTWQTLQARCRYKAVFQHGSYLPLSATGSQQDHLCAFLRNDSHTELLVIAPRLFTRLLASPQELPLGPAVWYDTRVLLPPSPREAWYRHLLTDEIILPVYREGRAVLPMAAVCAHFPVALLQRIEG